MLSQRSPVDRQVIGESHSRLPKAPDLQAGLRRVNGQRAIVATSGGKPYFVMMFDVAGSRLRSIHVMCNPKKLVHVAKG